MKHFYSVLIAFVLLLLASVHAISGADERGDSKRVEQNTTKFKNYIEKENLGTLDNGIWWFDPPENDEKTFLDNLSHGLELYMNYLDKNKMTPQNLDIDRLKYGFWSLKQEDLERYIEAKDDEEKRLKILKDYPVMTFPQYQYNVPFEEYVKQHELGEVKDGVWDYKPPEKLREKAPLTHLSYGLKFFEYYTGANDIDPWKAISRLQYGDWSLPTKVLKDYFQSSSTIEQSIKLGKYLNP